MKIIPQPCKDPYHIAFKKIISFYFIFDARKKSFFEELLSTFEGSIHLGMGNFECKQKHDQYFHDSNIVPATPIYLYNGFNQSRKYNTLAPDEAFDDDYHKREKRLH